MLVALLCSKGCIVNRLRWRLFGELEVEATAYCNCQKCCDWEFDKDGKSVYSKGRQKGLPKIVGKTSSGAMASHGTVAADISIIPMGTRLKIPGYGIGVVQDTGGAIKGSRLDLWFPTHEAALRWGRRKLRVTKLPR